MSADNRWRAVFLAACAVWFAACAGTMRDCASCNASNFGSDWIVVQLRADGGVARCWELHDIAVDSSSHQDVYWQSADGHLVHVEGWYNRVQVANGDFPGAYRALGVSGAECIR